MRKVFAFGGMVALLWGLSGCGSKNTHEAVMEEMLGVTNEYITVMDGVKDEESAKTAKPKLEALQTRAKDLKKRAEALPKPTEEQQKKLAKDYAPKLVALLPKMMAAQTKQKMYPSIAGIDFDLK